MTTRGAMLSESAMSALLTLLYSSSWSSTDDSGDCNGCDARATYNAETHRWECQHDDDGCPVKQVEDALAAVDPVAASAPAAHCEACGTPLTAEEVHCDECGDMMREDEGWVAPDPEGAEPAPAPSTPIDGTEDGDPIARMGGFAEAPAAPSSIEAAAVAQMSAAVRVACPICQAKPGAECITPFGGVHAARFAAANRPPAAEPTPKGDHE